MLLLLFTISLLAGDDQEGTTPVGVIDCFVEIEVVVVVVTPDELCVVSFTVSPSPRSPLSGSMGCRGLWQARDSN